VSMREAGGADRWRNLVCPCQSYGGEMMAWIAIRISSF
jgi:hypothetical protein